MFTNKAMKIKQSSRHKLTAISAFTVAAIVLTVCGSSGSSFAAGTSSKGGSARGTLNVVEDSQYDPSMPGLDAALALKTFPAGLKVNEVVSSNGALTMAAGGADIVVGSASAIMPAILLGLNAKIVGATLPVWPQHMIVAASSHYTSFSDLKGAKFGVTSFTSAGAFSTLKLAKKEGWSTSQYSVVALGSLPALEAALQSGSIDAFAWNAVTAYQAGVDGYGKDLGTLGPIVGNVPIDVITVSTSALKNHANLVNAFLTGFYKAQSILKSQPTTATSLFEKWGLSPATAQGVLPTALAGLATAPGITKAEIVGMTGEVRASGPANALVRNSQIAAMVESDDSALYVVASRITGVAVPGRRVVMHVLGLNFYGTPKVTSNAAGTTVRVVKTQSSTLSLLVTTRAGTGKGVHLLTARFAQGQVIKIRYNVN